VSKLILRSKMEMLKSMMRTSKRRSDKSRISIGDVERMATYLVDIAAPLRADGERLAGVLVMLTGNKPKTSKVVADEELTTKHELRVAHVNPSEEHKLDNIRTVKEVLQVTR
jgi:hypothetical protein